MTATRSKLAADVYRYLGDIPDSAMPEGMPLQTVLMVLSQVEDERLREMELSTEHRRVSKVDVSLTPDDNTFTLNRTDFSAPAHVYLSVDNLSSPLDWYAVEITNHASLYLSRRDAKLAVSFYGTNPQKGEVSWEPDSNETLRIWYDKSGEDAPLLLGNTEVGSLYESYVALEAAAQCMELMKMPVGDVMRSRLSRSEGQWKRSVTQSRQQGLADKPPVWLPGRFRRRGPSGGFRLP